MGCVFSRAKLSSRSWSWLSLSAHTGVVQFDFNEAFLRASVFSYYSDIDHKLVLRDLAYIASRYSPPVVVATWWFWQARSIWSRGEFRFVNMLVIELLDAPIAWCKSCSIPSGKHNVGSCCEIVAFVKNDTLQQPRILFEDSISYDTIHGRHIVTECLQSEGITIIYSCHLCQGLDLSYHPDVSRPGIFGPVMPLVNSLERLCHPHS